MIDTIRRSHLSRAAITDILDAKRDDLYDEPIGTLDEYRARADRTEGTVIDLKAQILLDRRDEVIEGAARHAGRALAVVKTIQALSNGATPLHMTIPLDLLKRDGIGAAEVLMRRTSPAILSAIGHLRQQALEELLALRGLRDAMDVKAAAAFLPVNLVAPILQRTGRTDYDPFTSPLDLPQWRCQWIFWRAAGRRGVQ